MWLGCVDVLSPVAALMVTCWAYEEEETGQGRWDKGQNADTSKIMLACMTASAVALMSLKTLAWRGHRK